MGIDIDPCNTGLVLGLGLSIESSYTTPKKQIMTANYDHHQKLDGQDLHLHHHQFGNSKLIISDYHHHHHRAHEPSLTLSLSGDDHHHETCATVVKRVDDHSDFLIKNKVSAAIGFNNNDQISGDASAASSLSNVSVKRERTEVVVSEDVVEMEKVISSSRVVISDEDDDGSNGTRKKLRLTKAQSALLEESFKHHTTLNPKQKQDLARELKLRQRQVEVWFQNRRARTKLKQTEVDCEVLKKYCETLTEENRRLQKEVQELKALKLAAQPPLCMQLPAATLTMCPSCERIGDGSAGEVAGVGATKRPFTMAAMNNKSPTPPPHFYNPFMTNPPSAC